MNETSERINKPTPNGGAYSIAYFRDAAGNPTTKDKAVEVEVVEYTAEGKAILHTSARIA